MPERRSTAEWRGTLKEGSGTMRLASGRYEGPYTYSSRFEEAAGTNPEELIGAAHAGCFSMFLAMLLADNGYTPERIQHLREGEDRRGAHDRAHHPRERGGGARSG